MKQLLRNNSGFGGGVITVHGAAGTRRPTPRRVRDNSTLHVSAGGEVISTASGVPPVLQSRVYYIPAVLEDLACAEDPHITFSANQCAQVYVLWPSLQEPPPWLRADFQPLLGAELKVSWSFRLRERALLNISNRRRAFEQQTLQVWRCTSAVEDGTCLGLPGLAADTAHASGLPLYPYIFCVRLEAPDACVAVSANRRLSELGKQPQQTHLLRCTTQQLRTRLASGLLNVLDVSEPMVDCLLRKCVAEDDPELLLQLLEEGLGLLAGPGVLQQVLEYAVAHQELQVVQEVLALGSAELSQAALDWWVGELVGGPNLFDAERLLADYCLVRRNRLSSVAAVEAALLTCKVRTPAALPGVVQLGLKFRAVKRALLQQLLEQHNAQLAAAALSDTVGAATPDVDTVRVPGKPLAAADVDLVIRSSMEVHPWEVSQSSIHDRSPLRAALQLSDAVLLGEPAVKSFVQQVWQGMELQELYGPAAAPRASLRSLSRKSRMSMDASSHWGTAFKAATAVHRFKQAGLAAQQQQQQQQLEPQPPLHSSSATGGKQRAAVLDGSSNGALKHCEAALQQASPALHDPTIGYELLQNMGLAAATGSGSGGALAAGCGLVHLVLLAPRAFFNSPRGQWVMHCWIEVVFLLAYQLEVLGANPLGLRLLFSLLVLGNLVRVVDNLLVQHRGDVRRYLSSHFSKLDVLVHVGLSVVVVGWVAEGLVMPGWATNLEAALGVLVWARALGVVVPANARLGALLYTLGRMVEAAYPMAIIIGALLLGFSTTLYAAYHNLLPPYGSFSSAFRITFGTMAGDIHLEDFDTFPEDAFHAWMGAALTMCFVVVVNILLISLLIAVCNHTYSPETVTKQTNVMFAGAVDSYALQAGQGVAWPPLNILQLLLAWAPRRARRRLPHTFCLQLWLPPLDGYSAASGPPRATGPLLTGPAELSYTLFLVTLYPVIAVCGVVLILLHIPAGMVTFARQGYKLWLRQAAVTSRGSKAKGDAAGWQTPDSHHASLDIPRGSQPGSGRPSCTGAQPTPALSALATTPAHPPQPSWVCQCWRVVAAWLQPVTAVVGWTLLGFFAAGLQLSLVLLLVVTLTYSLLAQIGWSLACALFWRLLPASIMQAAGPAATDKRCADWWTANHLEAAYAAHKVLHGQGSMRRSLGHASVRSPSTRHSLNIASSAMSACTQPLVSSSSQVAGNHGRSGIIPPVAQDHPGVQSSRHNPVVGMRTALAHTSGLYGMTADSSHVAPAPVAAEAWCAGSGYAQAVDPNAPRSAPSLGGMP